MRADAALFLENHIPPGQVDEVLVFFPDPWPTEGRGGERTEEATRRIVRPDVVDSIERVLRPGGLLHVATDVLDYAQWCGRPCPQSRVRGCLGATRDTRPWNRRPRMICLEAG